MGRGGEFSEDFRRRVTHHKKHKIPWEIVWIKGSKGKESQASKGREGKASKGSHTVHTNRTGYHWMNMAQNLQGTRGIENGKGRD